MDDINPRVDNLPLFFEAKDELSSFSDFWFDSSVRMVFFLLCDSPVVVRNNTGSPHINQMKVSFNQRRHNIADVHTEQRTTFQTSFYVLTRISCFGWQAAFFFTIGRFQSDTQLVAYRMFV